MMRTGGHSPLRRLAFAGTWYADDPHRLAREVDAALGAARAPTAPARAIVSPHAGLRYSGHVAACSYRALGSSAREAVVLVGPSHYEAFRGCAMLRRGALQSPWGELPIAEGLADALGERTGLVSQAFEAIHAREHSLELQLPFLARVLPEVPIIPILMGEQTRAVAVALGDAMAEAFAGRDVVYVASSDLSHYQDATTAQRMDRVVLDALDAMDADRLMAALEREPHHACGGGPMVAVLRAARRVGATTGGVLKYADSGDVTGDKSSVVGYVSAAYAESGSQQ
jgi:AmmeMemoRadiSam system protein B